MTSLTMPPHHFVVLYWSENVKKKRREEPQMMLWTQESSTINCAILKPDSLKGRYPTPNQASKAIRNLYNENPSVNWKMQWGVVSVHRHVGSTRNFSVTALGSKFHQFLRPLSNLQCGVGSSVRDGLSQDLRLVPFDKATPADNPKTALVPFVGVIHDACDNDATTALVASDPACSENGEVKSGNERKRKNCEVEDVQAHTFFNKLARIKNELNIDANTTALLAIHEANSQMGIKPIGNARAQVDYLMTLLQ